MNIDRFEDLEIWQEARKVCKYIFELTQKDPFCNDYKLKDQIKSSSGSIMDNIAEGFERGGNKEFIQFLSIAKGSCGECRSQSYRAHDYSYINKEVLDELVLSTTRLSKKISNLILYLKKSPFTGHKFKS
jgi:four helix bundle protein